MFRVGVHVSGFLESIEISLRVVISILCIQYMRFWFVLNLVVYMNGLDSEPFSVLSATSNFIFSHLSYTCKMIHFPDLSGMHVWFDNLDHK